MYCSCYSNTRGVTRTEKRKEGNLKNLKLKVISSMEKGIKVSRSQYRRN
jgi:hypothetical protein